MIQRAAMAVSERDGNSGEMSEGSEDARQWWRWRTAKPSTSLALPQRIVRNRREQKGLMENANVSNPRTTYFCHSKHVEVSSVL